MTVITTNSGVSDNGTIWVKFDTGNVDLTFVDGSKMTINPTALGLTLDEAILSFELQAQKFNAILQLNDVDFIAYLQDFFGAPSSDGTINNSEDVPTPGPGLPNGIALLPATMSLSQHGLQNIMSLMGFFPTPVLNNLNQWIVGFQHILSSSELQFFLDGPIGMQRGIQMLLGDIMSVHLPMIQNLIRIPLTQQQFDSLLSSSLAMGPTRFAQSGIPAAVNNGDFAGAADIRRCYNGTNGEYDPAKGYAANVDALGMTNAADSDGQTTLIDPAIAGDVQASPASTNSPLHTPIPGLVDSINSSAKTSTSLSPQLAAETLYGIAHHESLMGNANTPFGGGSSASGPYHIVNKTWLGYVRDYGQSVPELKAYSTQLRKYTDLNNVPVALRNQVLPLKNNPTLSSQMVIKAIDNYYVPTLQSKGLPVNAGSIWNMHYMPANVTQNVRNQLNWNSVGLGRIYAGMYFR